MTSVNIDNEQSIHRNQDKPQNQKFVLQCGEMSHLQQHPVIFPRQRQLQRSLELVQRLGRADHGAELLPVGGGRQELGSGVSISVTCHVSRVTCPASRVTCTAVTRSRCS